MPTPAPQKEETASRIASLQSKLASLEKDTRLTQIRDAVEDLQTKISSLGQTIAGLRSRGYVFGKDFEPQAENFSDQWTRCAPGVLSQVNQQANRLQAALTPLRTKMTALVNASGNVAQAQNLARQLEAETGALESQANAAQAQVRGMYDSLQSQVNGFHAQLKQVDWMLDQLAEAAFQMLATEAGVMAVKAVLVRGGREEKEDPDGVLYLTDQRLVFEQKEEVATKKVLFIATEKQKIQNVLFESPVGLVETVKTSKQGLFKNEDHIEIGLGTGAPVRSIHFHIWQSCEEWQALINRVKTREIEKERAVAVDAGAVARLKSAPSQCPGCGGNISQVILRGQDTVKCEFCGFVIRL